MRIIKAPLRVSLFGGGTDLPEYYQEHGSTIISFAIDKHIYLVHNPRPTGGYRLTYSEVEELSTLTDAKHTLIRQAALIYGNPEPCTLSIISDVPKGTGLGSSSSLAVAICLMFGHPEYSRGIVKAAYELERAHSNCGVQDHLPPSFGGFNVYQINCDGGIIKTPVPERMIKLVEKYGLLLYTGLDREADAILKTWKKSTDSLYKIHGLADSVSGELDTITPERLGELLNYTGRLKAVIGGVVNPELEAQYETAIKAGAMGGKLLGAGGGGCWFFVTYPGMRQAIIEATGLKEIPFRVSRVAVRTIYA